MNRFAAIDIGTNSVLLLIAERDSDGQFCPILERAEITRLGRGVDRTHRLSESGIRDTLAVVADYLQQARSAGAGSWVVSATSAARDAENGPEFLSKAKEEAGVEITILSGDREARLVYRAVSAEFGPRLPGQPLLAIDIGGGSTEFIYGGPPPGRSISFHRSYDVGSVRLTERYFRSDPVGDRERAGASAELRAAFSPLPPRGDSAVVGVAGTVTTLFAIQNQIEPYDAARVHGGTLTLEQLTTLTDRLLSTPLEERKRLPGLQPKRADVICAGAMILQMALEQLGATHCLVSDRGLRWGLLLERFGPGCDDFR